MEKLVTRSGPAGEEKKYYRFRPARWYGGIVTADCVGCGLRCRFCWVRDSVMLRPVDAGDFYTPSHVADKMVAIAESRHFKQLRISGGEPTLGKAHLLQLLNRLKSKGLSFILETNGIPIAYDRDYAEELSPYSFVQVRVSLKGCNEEEFSALTGANPEGFRLQLESLKKLSKAGIRCHPSVMVSFSTKKRLQALVQRLKAIDAHLAENMEVEELILYPHVVKRLQRYEMHHGSGHEPSNVPREQI